MIINSNTSTPTTAAKAPTEILFQRRIQLELPMVTRLPNLIIAVQA